MLHCAEEEKTAHQWKIPVLFTSLDTSSPSSLYPITVQSFELKNHVKCTHSHTWADCRLLHANIWHTLKRRGGNQTKIQTHTQCWTHFTHVCTLFALVSKSVAAKNHTRILRAVCVCVCLCFKLKNKNQKIKQEASKSQPRHKLFRSFFQHSSSTSRAHCFSLIGWNYSRVVVFIVMRCALLPHRPSLPDPDDMARRHAVTSTTSWSGSWRNVTNSRTAVWGSGGLKWSLRYSTNFDFF